MTTKTKKNIGRKGSQYETELAKYLTENLGTPVYRTPLSGGGFSDVQMADLFGAPEIWIEAKRTERMNIALALEQAERGIKLRKSPDVPVVITRKNRVPTGASIVAMRLEDWVRIYHGYLLSQGYIRLPKVADDPSDFFE